MSRAFGVYFETAGFSNRALVIVDPEGTVQWSWEGDPRRHAGREPHLRRPGRQGLVRRGGLRGLHPLDELDDDPVGVGHLEVALAPRLGLDRRRDRHALALEALVLGVDVVDDERDEQAVGVAAPQRSRA